MDSDHEYEEKHNTVVITDQPPAYTVSSSSISTNVMVGGGVGVGVGAGMHDPYHPGPYGPYGPGIVQSHHNGLVTNVTPSGMVITTFTAKPARITCQSCNAAIVTRCERKATWKTHFFAMAFAMVCCLPCCCAVYCIDDCKSADHYCPECSSYIGSYVI